MHRIIKAFIRFSPFLGKTYLNGEHDNKEESLGASATHLCWEVSSHWWSVNIWNERCHWLLFMSGDIFLAADWLLMMSVKYLQPWRFCGLVRYFTCFCMCIEYCYCGFGWIKTLCGQGKHFIFKLITKTRRKTYMPIFFWRFLSEDKKK